MNMTKRKRPDSRLLSPAFHIHWKTLSCQNRLLSEERGILSVHLGFCGCSERFQSEGVVGFGAYALPQVG